MSFGGRAGLKVDDRIIEVNGSPIDGLTHQDVIQLVKSVPGNVTLLVVDADADNYFRSRQITIGSHLPSVKRITCPDSNPNSASVAFAATAAAGWFVYH
jgi:hypothetical protein